MSCKYTLPDCFRLVCFKHYFIGEEESNVPRPKYGHKEIVNQFLTGRGLVVTPKSSGPHSIMEKRALTFFEEYIFIIYVRHWKSVRLWMEATFLSPRLPKSWCKDVWYVTIINLDTVRLHEWTSKLQTVIKLPPRYLLALAMYEFLSHSTLKECWHFLRAWQRLLFFRVPSANMQELTQLTHDERSNYISLHGCVRGYETARNYV